MLKKGKNKGSSQNGEDTILIEESGESYDASQLKEAFKSASSLAAEKKISVTLLFSSGNFVFKGQLSFAENLILKSSEGANVILDSGFSLLVKGGKVEVEGITFSFNKRNKKAQPIFAVNKQGDMSFEKCVFEPNENEMKSILGISNKGKLTVYSSTLRKFRIESFSEASLTLSKFLGEGSDTCGVTALSPASNLSVKDSTFRDVSSGINSSGGSITVIGSSFETSGDGILLKNTTALIDRCQFTSTEKSGLVVSTRQKVIVKNSSFNTSIKGVSAINSGKCKLISCEFVECAQVGVEASDKLSEVTLESTNFSGGATKAFALHSFSEGSIVAVDVTIAGFKRAVYIEKGFFSFNGLTIRDSENAMFGEHGNITGNNLNIEKVSEGIEIEGAESNIRVSDVRMVGGKRGITLRQAKGIYFSDVKIMSIDEVGIKIEDSVFSIARAHVNNSKSGGDGIDILFTKQSKDKCLLDECKVQSCKNGIKIVQHKLVDGTADDAVTPVETYLDNSTHVEDNKEHDMALTDLQNCSFIKCHIGFSIDRARANVKGCSFIMSTKHSIFIENEKLEKGHQLRKKSKLKIRWVNFVEPRIDNTNALSNDVQFMTVVTDEKSFVGSADFEPVMYLPTLVERLRQAKSQEKNSSKAIIIMRSIHHMLVLLKKLTKKMLEGELLDDPELGMFAATFQLFGKDHKNKTKKTLIHMEMLFESWKSLSRTRLFDRAISALNDAFSKKLVSEELYDAWISPLEELQREKFSGSKYNRRRDYLLQTAKHDPLSAWYFLDKEDGTKSEGKRLRGEVLRYLAKDDDRNQLSEIQNFHASWVSQWAVNLLGDDFTNSGIPGDRALRRAWCDKLLDNKNPGKILSEYRKVDNLNEFKTEVDHLLRFEALQLLEALNGTLKPEDLQTLTSLFNGKGYSEAVKYASRLYKGQGALPGFLRRCAERAHSPESLLELLSHLYEDNPQESSKGKKETVLAVLSHFLNPDSQSEPIIEKKSTKYETCQACLVQKLQPWNVMRLSACPHNHRFSKSCFKTSMSSAHHGLRGTCCGVDEKNKPCTALATRREMEMVSMDKETISSILESRISSALAALKGWKPCDSPGCIGGRSRVTKDYYSCLLCKKMVTKDGGKSDPTVAKRLLQGLDGSPIARGEGIFRECYHCAVIYEKGNACSTITCQHCQKQFSMTWGPEHISHRFDEEGVGPQMYVPKKAGKLWELGVFKTKKGKPLELGKVLNDKEAAEVVRRAKVLLKKLEG